MSLPVDLEISCRGKATPSSQPLDHLWYQGSHWSLSQPFSSQQPEGLLGQRVCDWHELGGEKPGFSQNGSTSLHPLTKNVSEITWMLASWCGQTYYCLPVLGCLPARGWDLAFPGTLMLHMASLVTGISLFFEKPILNFHPFPLQCFCAFSFNDGNYKWNNLFHLHDYRHYRAGWVNKGNKANSFSSSPIQTRCSILAFLLYTGWTGLHWLKLKTGSSKSFVI